jgi:hypothetical protein
MVVMLYRKIFLMSITIKGVVAMKKILIVLLVLGLVVSIGFNVMGSYERFYQKSNNYIQNGDGKCKIIVDQKTGVNYLIYVEWTGYGVGVGICPMYDSNGKILVEK